MFHSLLLLCTLYKPIASVVLWPVTGKPAVAQTVNPVDRGSWNKSASFSNDTDPNLRVVSSPSLNATGQSLWNSPNSSLEQALWPSLDTYNNVSYLLIEVFYHEVTAADALIFSFRTNVSFGIVNAPATGQKRSTYFSIIQAHCITWSTARIAFGHANWSALLGYHPQRHCPTF